MTRNQMGANLMRRICLGNEEAMDFLANHWVPYVHAIDDIIDGETKDAETIIGTFARAITLYSHPFYLKHLPELRTMVLLVTNTYADTVAWEKSPIEWQRQWADQHRHCSNDLALAVATICGGYAHARTFMLELRVICYAEHHDAEGKPV